MAVNRKFPEYVILVNPTTLQPYVASGGGGGISSSVNILDAGGTAIAAGNPFPITGTVTVGSLPSVTIATLPSLPAGSATIGNVTVSSLPALPAGANLIGSVNINNTPAVTVSGSVPLSNAATADYDSGAGTVTQVMVGLALPASGGPVAGGTAANPLVVNVNNNPAVTVSGSVTANQGGTWNVTVNTALPTGANVIGAVTQSGTWNVTVNAALPTGANVIGGVTQSGPWTVQQGGAPWSVSPSGTWNVTVNAALPAGSNVIGGVTQSGSPWGVKTEVQLDYDSGAGTQNLSLVGLALPAAGGAVAGGTATNPFTVAGSVAITGAVTVTGTVTANQGGAPWSVSQSGTWNVGLSTGANVIGAVTQSGTWNMTVNTALPAGSNSIGTVVVSQLPTAALLANGTANPTTTVVGSLGMVYNGTSWDPWKDASAANNLAAFTGIPAVNLSVLDTGTSQMRRTVSAASAVAGGLDGTHSLSTGPLGYDGTAFYNLRLDASKNLQVNVNAALPAGANLIGAVTQSGTWTVQQGNAPWSVTTSASVATTAARTSVASGVTAVTLLAANSARKGATIFNDSSKVLKIALGSGVSATDFTQSLGSMSYYEVPFGYTGIITGIWAASNGAARITEVS